MTAFESLVRRVYPVGRIPTVSPMRLWLGLVAVWYVLVSALGITTSSLGMPSILDTPTEEASGLLIGAPDAIRTDEYLRATPWSLGTMASGDQDFGTPLSYPDAALVAVKLGGPATSVLFPETKLQLWLGQWLPEQAFAAIWWLPILMVALGLPLWFRRLGVGSSVSVPITLIVVMAPVSVWWSWGPLNMLGLTVVCGASALAAAARLREGRLGWQGLGLLILSCVALARLGLSYQPWAIPLGALVLIPTLAAILVPPARRLHAIALVVSIAVIGLLLFGAFLLEHRESAQIIAETVYPGSRRFIGTLVSPAALLAAPHLWVLQQSPPLANTNPSEITSGPLVLAAVALCLVPAITWSRAKELRLVAATSAVVLAGLGTWSTVDWPNKASVLFPMNLVAPDRLAQVLGLAAALTFAFFFVAWRRSLPSGRRMAVVSGSAVAAFFLTAIGGSSLRQLNLPSYRSVWIILVALVTASVVAVAVAYADRRWALLPAAFLWLATTIFVSPIQMGFADLQDGDAAVTVRELTKKAGPGARWIADDIHADALLMANAAPALSGQQWLGPDESAWKVLDPSGRHESEWNRGASYVTFTWAEPGDEPRLSLPAGDVIVVSVDPCDPRLDRFDVRLVMAATELDRSCLSLATTFSFGNGPRFVYERRG